MPRTHHHGPCSSPDSPSKPYPLYCGTKRIDKITLTNAFFRSGVTGGWKGKLTTDQANRFWQTNQTVMQNTNYPEEGQP